MTAFRPAPEVAAIAEQLIPKHHEHLIGHRCEYVFRDEAQKRKGKLVLGTAQKVGGLNAFLAQRLALDELPIEEDLDFFCVVIAEDTWAELTAKQRVALVDHELSHLQVTFNDDGEIKLGTVGHDYEEFGAVLDRHGLWKPDLADLGRRVAGVLSIPFPE